MPGGHSPVQKPNELRAIERYRGTHRYSFRKPDDKNRLPAVARAGSVLSMEEDARPCAGCTEEPDLAGSGSSLVCYEVTLLGLLTCVGLGNFGMKLWPDTCRSQSSSGSLIG